MREAFRNTVAGEFGNCGRNVLIAPSQWNVDFSAMKDFRITEGHAIQFRMEMFNAPNHPGLGPSERGVGNAESDARGKLRAYPVDEPVAADPVCPEVSLLMARSPGCSGRAGYNIAIRLRLRRHGDEEGSMCDQETFGKTGWSTKLAAW